MAFDNDKPVSSFSFDDSRVRPKTLSEKEFAVKPKPLSDEEITALAEKFEPSSVEFKDAASILQKMADTFRERNKVYGDNYLNVGNVIAALFPNGVTLRYAEDFNRWHLFELIIVKLTRFANSGLLHKDSIHDASVYGAMVESLTHDEASKLGH